MESLLAILFCIVPLDLAATDSVDCVERNWVTSPCGQQLHFVQLLLCDVDLNTGEKRVREWRIVDVERGEYEGFEFAAAKGPHLGKRMIWDDKGTLRDITVGYTTETVTPYDAEMVEQQDWRKEWRRPLSGVRQAKSRVRGR